MPVLDAKALDNDPDGMAFLRSVVRPNFDQEEAASAPGHTKPPIEAAPAPAETAEAPESPPVRTEVAVVAE